MYHICIGGDGADINKEHENEIEDIKGTLKEGKIYLLIKVMCISHMSLTSTC
jgi:hypothetical protein